MHARYRFTPVEDNPADLPVQQIGSAIGHARRCTDRRAAPTMIMPSLLESTEGVLR
jgi:hypothetical protein